MYLCRCDRCAAALGRVPAGGDRDIGARTKLSPLATCENKKALLYLGWRDAADVSEMIGLRRASERASQWLGSTVQRAQNRDGLSRSDRCEMDMQYALSSY